MLVASLTADHLQDCFARVQRYLWHWSCLRQFADIPVRSCLRAAHRGDLLVPSFSVETAHRGDLVPSFWVEAAHRGDLLVPYFSVETAHRGDLVLSFSVETYLFTLVYEWHLSFENYFKSELTDLLK